MIIKHMAKPNRVPYNSINSKQHADKQKLIKELEKIYKGKKVY